MVGVLLSIKPKWCKKIAEGSKTIEVRKSRPKVTTPFKCFIYCTSANTRRDMLTYAEYCGYDMQSYKDDFVANCKIIGEFICDHIYQYTTANHIGGTDIDTDSMTAMSGLSWSELQEYEYNFEPKENCINLIGLYGWHISDLVIYDRPKELSELMGLRKTKFGYALVPMDRAPQSWRYVEVQEKKSDTPTDQS